jgi:hypothetical protein
MQKKHRFIMFSLSNLHSAFSIMSNTFNRKERENRIEINGKAQGNSEQSPINRVMLMD